VRPRAGALVATDVRSGLLLAVNHSGDSDSTGAITGNILGAQLGVEALPADLVDGLAERDLVRTVADDFVARFVTDAEPDLERYPPW
jgi:ADP-ribosyl-[dinitrogen reductase] hydrolase